MARWVEVLQSFLVRDHWAIRDLASHAGIPRSAVHRILTEMVSLGLVEGGLGANHYRVGPVLTRLVVLLGDRLDVPRISGPILEEVSAKTGETVMLGIYAANRRQFSVVTAVESQHAIRYIWESLRPWSDLHIAASGKGILAFLPDAERDAIVDALPDPAPGLGDVSRAELMEQLLRARAAGYAISHGERFAGSIGVAAPVRDAAGRVIGDIIVSWPDNRTSSEREVEFGHLVADAAARLSQKLGYLGAPNR